MNRLLTLLTLAGCGVAACGTVAVAVPLAAGVDSPAMPGLLHVQLGNGGPIGGGPNGTGNGVGGGTFRGAAPSGAAPFGAGAGATGLRLPGAGASGSGLPAGSNSRPNGAKPAPMQANGVRKIQ